MKKNTMLVTVIFLLPILFCQRADTGGVSYSVRQQFNKRAYKDKSISILVDSLAFYKCKLDSAKMKSKRKVLVLKKLNSELQEQYYTLKNTTDDLP